MNKRNERNERNERSTLWRVWFYKPNGEEVSTVAFGRTMHEALEKARKKDKRYCIAQVVDTNPCKTCCKRKVCKR